MPFDDKLFMKSVFSARTTDVSVAELKEHFDGDPIWQVRGLTGEEVARANDAVEQNKTMALVAEAISGSDSERVESFKELFGVSEDSVPDELVRRKTMLVMGSVSPVSSEELAVKLADTFPTVFFKLTTEIIKLTGLGKTPGKSKPSGKKQTSETA